MSARAMSDRKTQTKRPQTDVHQGEGPVTRRRARDKTAEGSLLGVQAPGCLAHNMHAPEDQKITDQDHSETLRCLEQQFDEHTYGVDIEPPIQWIPAGVFRPDTIRSVHVHRDKVGIPMLKWAMQPDESRKLAECMAACMKDHRMQIVDEWSAHLQNQFQHAEVCLSITASRQTEQLDRLQLTTPAFAALKTYSTRPTSPLLRI